MSNARSSERGSEEKSYESDTAVHAWRTGFLLTSVFTQPLFVEMTWWLRAF